MVITYFLFLIFYFLFLIFHLSFVICSFRPFYLFMIFLLIIPTGSTTNDKMENQKSKIKNNK